MPTRWSASKYPKNIIIRQICKRSHVSSQLVCEFIQRFDDEPAFTDAELYQILIQLLIECLIIFSLSRDFPSRPILGLYENTIRPNVPLKSSFL